MPSFLETLAAGWIWLQSAALVTLLRVVGSAVVLVLLYRVLADPAAPEAPDQRDTFRRIGFALLGALVFFTLSERWQPEVSDPNEGRGFQAYQIGMMMHRVAESGLDQFGAQPGGPSYRKLAREQLEEAAKRLPQNLTVQRYSAVVLAEDGKYAAALERVERALSGATALGAARVTEERDVWRTLYGPEVPTAEALERAERKLQEYRLGWIGRVALLAAHRRRGEAAAPRELRQAVLRGATQYVLRVFPVSLTVFLIIPQLGLIVFGVGTVLIRTGVLRPAPREQHPVAPILWEGFVLALALMLTPRFLPVPHPRPGQAMPPGTFALLILSGDLAQVVAVAYLAWRLRRLGLGLREIGLTVRHLAANLALGATAAALVIPTGYVVAILASCLGQRLMPDMAPPYHPIQGLTATSSNPEVRWSLFLAAVVGAPLFEETFFRGCLYGALRRQHGVGPAILGSSAFFAMLHPQLPLGFLPLAALGAAFAALSEWRQSLVPGMIVHALNNGLAFLMLTTVFPPG